MENKNISNDNNDFTDTDQVNFIDNNGSYNFKYFNETPSINNNNEDSKELNKNFQSNLNNNNNINN